MKRADGCLLKLALILIAAGVLYSNPQWFRFGPARNPPGMDQQLELIYQQPVPKHPPLVSETLVQAGEAVMYYDGQGNPTTIFVDTNIDPAAVGNDYVLVIRTGRVDVTIDRGPGSIGYVANGPSGQLFTAMELLKIQDGVTTWWRIKVAASQGGFVPGVSHHELSEH